MGAVIAGWYTTEIGRHDGLPFYTVGQRKGLNITVKSSDSQPLFVLKLDAARIATLPDRELRAGRLALRAA